MLMVHKRLVYLELTILLYMIDHQDMVWMLFGKTKFITTPDAPTKNVVTTEPTDTTIQPQRVKMERYKFTKIESDKRTKSLTISLLIIQTYPLVIVIYLLLLNMGID